MCYVRIRIDTYVHTLKYDILDTLQYDTAAPEEVRHALVHVAYF